MTYGDINCRKIDLIDADNFNLWREIKYYDWIKTNIVKRKISPNFITPILYKIDSNSKIDWNKLEMIRTQKKSLDSIIKINENEKLINKMHNLKKNTGLLTQFIPYYFRSSKYKTIETKKKNDEENEDITMDSGKILILLTEAPTTNIIQWSSTIYESYGTIKKMVSTGYHSPDVWKSILFQLIYVCAVLQEKDIYFDTLTLENNIYIKDINYDSNAIGSWIYIIDNIEYYVPNYGYILVLDSKYSDIELIENLLPSTQSTYQKFKIYGNIYNNNSKYNNINLKPLIREQFINLINPDNFGYNFKIKGGSIPPDNILDILKLMWKNTEHQNIKDFIHEYFKIYLNNRIGTLLYDYEQAKINTNIKAEFNIYKGKLMVWQKRFERYEWVIYIDDNLDGLRKNIIRKENNIYINDSVFSGSLYSYPSDENIQQESTKKIRFDEGYIYETYNIYN